MSKATVTASASTGSPLIGALTIVFVILKLTHVIAWSWWWVLAPLWISAGLGIGTFLLVILIAGIVAAVGAVRR